MQVVVLVIELVEVEEIDSVASLVVLKTTFALDILRK